MNRQHFGRRVKWLSGNLSAIEYCARAFLLKFIGTFTGWAFGSETIWFWNVQKRPALLPRISALPAPRQRPFWNRAINDGPMPSMVRPLAFRAGSFR